jgi:hypothetical protein
MPDYINPSPPPTDPDEIAQAAFERVRLTFPNYDPRESQMATIVMVALAFRAAEIADLVPLIPKSIFRWFGANVIGLPPEDGGPAQATVTIFVRDDAGYTIDSDTVLSIEDDQGDTHLFSLDSDTVIPAGATSVSNVTVTALDDGEEANGITGGPTALVEALDYVISVTQQGTSNGGTEAEDDNTYLNRLSRRLGLIPRPVLAEDFAALAMVEFPEIWRMASLNHYSPGPNKIHRLNFNQPVTGGTFRILIEGDLTTNIAYPTTPAIVKAAIEVASPSVSPGDIRVTDTGANGYLIEWLAGPLAPSGPLANFFVWDDSTTGAGSVDMSTYQNYVTPNPAMAGVVSVAGQYADGTTLSAPLKAAVDALLQANREWGFIVNVVDFNYHDVDSTFTFTTLPNYNKSDVEARAEAAVAAYVSPATYGAPPNDARGLKLQPVIYYWELVGVLESVEGLDRLITLTIGLNGAVQSASDKTMSGDFPLPRPGNIIGTAS